jgi:pSer/pThr/pTyr-binding forkhead associated (FHA) protein
MGRGHESDLRINDISVSRCHALIKFKDGKFLLEDNVSKFGTLVLIKKRVSLLPGFNKAVQIGRTVINFSVKNMVSHNMSTIRTEVSISIHVILPVLNIFYVLVYF